MTLSDNQKEYAKNALMEASSAELVALAVGFSCALDWAEEDPGRLNSILDFLGQVDAASSEYLESVQFFG